MTDIVLHPAYVLRSYAWELLSRNYPEVWDKSKYGGLTPIVPVAEEPELSQYSGPRIVYGYVDGGSGENPERKTGSTSFAVYDNDFRRFTKTMNILHSAFERLDESATDINEFSSARGFDGIRFGWVGVAFTEGADPEDDEGGRQSAIIVTNYEYYLDYDIQTSFATYNPVTGKYAEV